MYTKTFKVCTVVTRIDSVNYILFPSTINTIYDMQMIFIFLQKYRSNTKILYAFLDSGFLIISNIEAILFFFDRVKCPMSAEICVCPFFVDQENVLDIIDIAGLYVCRSTVQAHVQPYDTMSTGHEKFQYVLTLFKMERFLNTRSSRVIQ